MIMIKLFCSVFIGLFLLCTGVLAEEPTLEGSPAEHVTRTITIDTIDADEYVVYASLFSSGKLDGIPFGYVVLEKSTKKEQINKELWKDLDGFIIDDFNSRNQKQYQLDAKFPEDKPEAGHGTLKIEVREQKDSRFGPFDTGRTYVSRVGFSRDRTEALVYVQHVATPESGIGHYVFLRKDSGRWIISGSTIGKIF